MLYVVILVLGVASFLLAMRSLRSMQKMDDVAKMGESLQQNRVLFHKDHTASSDVRPEVSVPWESES